MSNLPLNIDLQQIFLHLLNFTILLAGLYFLLYEPVKKFMNKRTAYYEDLDRQAKEKMEEARRVRRSYEERLMEAEEEIRQRGEEVQKSAAAQAQAQIQDAAEEAAHRDSMPPGPPHTPGPHPCQSPGGGPCRAGADAQRGPGTDFGHGGNGNGAAGAGQHFHSLRPIFSRGWRG